MGGEHAMEHYDVCIGPNLTCMNDLLNRMGQFDHVDYNGVQVKCRSNCEDQINSLFVTTSSYPNKKTLIYREEFCIVAKRLLEKCEGPKRKPLESEYPEICSTLHPLTTMNQEEFCKNNQWYLPRNKVPGCFRTRCPIEEVILDYARENLVMFNIFIKDPYAKRFQKDEKITKTSYIANSGGLLGLCMGFSFISGAEILFHCFFGVFSAIFPDKKYRQQRSAATCDVRDDDRELAATKQEADVIDEDIHQQGRPSSYSAAAASNCASSYSNRGLPEGADQEGYPPEPSKVQWSTTGTGGCRSRSHIHSQTSGASCWPSFDRSSYQQQQQQESTKAAPKETKDLLQADTMMTQVFPPPDYLEATLVADREVDPRDFQTQDGNLSPAGAVVQPKQAGCHFHGHRSVQQARIIHRYSQKQACQHKNHPPSKIGHHHHPCCHGERSIGSRGHHHHHHHHHHLHHLQDHPHHHPRGGVPQQQQQHHRQQCQRWRQPLVESFRALPEASSGEAFLEDDPLAVSNQAQAQLGNGRAGGGGPLHLVRRTASVDRHPLRGGLTLINSAFALNNKTCRDDDSSADGNELELVREPTIVLPAGSVRPDSNSNGTYSTVGPERII